MNKQTTKASWKKSIKSVKENRLCKNKTKALRKKNRTILTFHCENPVRSVSYLHKVGDAIKENEE